LGIVDLVLMIWAMRSLYGSLNGTGNQQSTIDNQQSAISNPALGIEHWATS
jgi:hypothetical protein